MSNYEGATEFWYGASRAAARDVIIEVSLLDVDSQRPKGDRQRVYTWRDSVSLRKGKEDGWLPTCTVASH